MVDPRLSRAEESVSPALEVRLARYALVAGAGLLAAPQGAQAGVIYTPANVWIGPNADYYLNLDNSGDPEFRIHNGWWQSGSYWGRELRVFPNGGGDRGIMAGGYGTKALALQPSQAINAYGNFARNTPAKMGYGYNAGPYGFHGPFGNWSNVNDRFLGLWFDLDGDGNGNYGWARLSVTDPLSTPGPFQVHLTGYAYETVTEQGIHPEAVPEPGTLGLLAGGILGLGLWRRRKRAA